MWFLGSTVRVQIFSSDTKKRFGMKVLMLWSTVFRCGWGAQEVMGRRPKRVLLNVALKWTANPQKLMVQMAFDLI